MPENLDKLESILKLVTESITRKDFEDAFRAVVAYIKDIKKTNEDEFTGIHEAFNVLSKKVSDEKDTAISDIKLEVQNALKKQIDAATAKLATVTNGKDGNDGKDADETEIIAQVLKQLPPYPIVPEQLLGEDMRNALEALQGEDRLDASAIKNLPEMAKDTFRGVLTATALYSLADVSVAGIVAGQSIQWDGIRWIPYTPSGSSSNQVFGEDLTPQGPGITYNLAHTPVTGTVRLYRGGAYQQLNVDYTISGATITLTQTTQAGENLLVDYNY